MPGLGPGLSGKVDAIQVQEWEAMPWLVHGFSTRGGGQTTAYGRGTMQSLAAEALPTGDLNLGFTTEDSRETVAVNRELLISHLLGGQGAGGGRAAGLVTARQTHSAVVHRVDACHTLSLGSSAVLEGDGLLTDTPGVLVGILTADCVPVLVVDPRHRAVAAFHAGWRGTLQRIVEEGIRRMQEEFGSVPREMLAAIGPAIGVCCYTVGEQMREPFSAQFTYAEEIFSTIAKPAESSAGDGPTLPVPTSSNVSLDLAAANRRQLLAAGLRDTAITMTDACTSCHTDRFFSHRAEHGVTGRMMSVIGVRAPE